MERSDGLRYGGLRLGLLRKAGGLVDSSAGRSIMTRFLIRAGVVTLELAAFAGSTKRRRQ